ncbi:MAG: NADP-dependent isocitrate dehydrogenase [Deltaproteobacteria bacterium]|jgi:isocitrate dehydrogenase|nr:NADP-dependent isocitrate dehydrogenase [Deltaproteobacteria bacterium]
MPRKITFENGSLNVPDDPFIPFIEGDGVGPELWRAAGPVLLAAAEKTGRAISFVPAEAGAKAFERTGAYLPPETLVMLESHRVSIKGPLATPVGGGIRSLNVAIRQALDLYACVRPVSFVPGVPSPVKAPEKVDMIVFRENTEDLYAGIEWPSGSPEAESLREFLNARLGTRIAKGAALGVKPMTEAASKRLVRMAVRWALKEGRPSVTLVHKGNIMKYTEGAFRKWGYEVAAEEFGDRTVPEAEAAPAERKVIVKDRIADNMFMQILLRPAEYSVLAMPNLNGDYLSDALAAQTGGLGMAPGANIGDGVAVFEATHGTAPKYEGKDVANPSSLILSGALMLDHLGWRDAGDLVRSALRQAVADGLMTNDLARQIPGAKACGTAAFGKAVLERVRRDG